MAATIETHRITINDDDFVVCTNSSDELRARTALVAHLDKDALILLPWGPTFEQTIFYPAYRSEDYWKKGDMHALIDGLQMEPNEGVIFGTKGSYTTQACLGVFPRNVEATTAILNRWLNTQRRFLTSRSYLKVQIDEFIDEKLKKMVEANAESE